MERKTIRRIDKREEKTPLEEGVYHFKDAKPPARPLSPAGKNKRFFLMKISSPRTNLNLTETKKQPQK